MCSTVNIIVLIQRQGRETGWIFLLWGKVDVTINAVAVFFMTGGSVDQGDERRPSESDVGPSTYPLAAVAASVPAVSAASLARLPHMHNAGAITRSPDSPSTDESNMLPSASPREPKNRLSPQSSTNRYRGPIITVVPTPKLAPQAQESFASEEHVHLKLYQHSSRSGESSLAEGGVIHAKVSTRDDVAEEHSEAGDLSSHWWAPSPPAVIPEGEGERNTGFRIPNSRIDASSGLASSQCRIRDLRTGSKR